MTDLAIRKSKGSLHSIYYNSLYDFYTTKRIGGINEYGQNDHNERVRGGKWFGGNEEQQGKDVIKKAMLGDPILYKSLKEKISSLDERLGTFTAKGFVQKVAKSKRVTVHGKMGDEIDIHKVNSGKLDTAWSKKIRKTVDSQHKLVTLYIDLSHNSNKDCLDTLWTSAVSVKLLADLEKEGKSVKIIVGGTVQSSLSGSRDMVSVGITVKEYNERLAPERLAAMSHLGFYRSWGFMAHHDHNFGRVCSSIGHALGNVSQHHLPINIQEEIEKGHTRLIVIQKSLNLWDAERSIKSARKQIADFKD